MEKFLKGSIFLVLFSLVSLGVDATTYYVNATTGNNAANGLTAGTAWRTIEYALTRPLSSGDILQLSADTFTENGPLNIPVGVSLFGSGVTQTVIQANASYFFNYTGSEDYNQHFLIQVSSGAYTVGNQTLKDFTIEGGPNTSTRQLHGGIYVKNRGSVTVENINVRYTNFCAIWFYDVKNSVMRNVSTLDCSWGSTGWASGAIQLANLENVELDDLDINEARGYGLKGLPHEATYLNLKIHSSRFSVNPDGLWQDGLAPNITLELWASAFPGCEIYDNYFDNTLSLVYPAGAPYNQPSGLKVYNNTFDILPPSRANGDGYGMECSINDVEIYGNHFNGGGRGIASFMGHKHYNWNIHHNIFNGLSSYYPTSAIFLSGGQPTGPKDGGVIGLTIANNTMEMTGSSTLSLYNAGYESETSGVVIKNNLVINNSSGGQEFGSNKVIRLADIATMTPPDMTNNDFYNISSAGDAGSLTNNLNVNPSITASGTKPTPYYTLTSNSTSLIDAGVNMGYPYLGSGPDIGAYEFSSSSSIPVTGVALSPSNLSLSVGANSPLTKTITPSNATNQNVTWSSSNTSIATVNSAGVVTGVAAGSATITVTTVDGNKTATSAITVTASSGNNVVLNPEFDSGSTNWTLGDWTGPTGGPAGNALSLVQGAGLSGSNAAYIDVVNTHTDVWRLQLYQTLSSFVLQVGKTYEISFMAKAQSPRTIGANIRGNTTNAEYWNTNATPVNLTTTAQNFGPYTYTCNNGGVTGEASFSIAFFLAGNTINDVWIDKVSVKDISNVAVTSVSVSPTTATLAVGATSQLTKTISPANATNQNITWSTSNASVATVNSAGVVSGVSAGTATITVTTQDGSFIATSNITVNSNSVVTIVDNAVLGSGTNQHNYTGAGWTHAATVPAFLNSTLSYSNTTNNAVTLSFTGNKIEWYTEKKNTHGIAAVSIDNGTEVNVDLYAATAQQQLLVYTSPALSEGTHSFKIRVTGTKNAASTNFYAIHDYVKVYSAGVAVTGVSVSPTTATLTIGGITTQQLTKLITPGNATNQNVTWTTTNPGVATVNTSGLVTAVGAGIATITATTEDGSFTGNSTVTVNTTTTVDNAVLGTATNQHNYTGAGWTHAATVPAFLNSTLSYSNTTNNAVTLSFTGNKIEWYTEKKNTHGIAAVSIDNGTEVTVDLYAATEQQQLLVYTSPILSQGTHSFKIRVTGTKNAASTNFYAIHDYVKIYSSSGGGEGGRIASYTSSEMNEEQLVAYPNPVKRGEILHLTIPEGTSEVKMIDPMGRVHPVRQQVIDRKIEISTSILSTGMNFIQYRNRKGLKHAKIVIE